MRRCPECSRQTTGAGGVREFCSAELASPEIPAGPPVPRAAWYELGGFGGAAVTGIGLTVVLSAATWYDTGLPLDRVGLATVLLTGLAVMGWLWRARRNLDLLVGARVREASAWALLGWVVPVFNLFMPLRVVREVAWLSVGARWVRPVAVLWWASYLLFLLMPGADGFGVRIDSAFASAGLVCLVVAGGCLIALIVAVGRGQRTLRAALSSRPATGQTVAPVLPQGL